MTKISALSADEAVYSLYRSVEPYGGDVDLDDPAAVRELVRAGFATVAGEDRAVELVARLESEAEAPDFARACLEVLHDRPELIEGAPATIDEYLRDPPSAEKMDFGISLGLLALAGMAMAFMGSLEIRRETEEGPHGRRTSSSVSFRGSEKVPELAKAVLESIGL